MLRSVSCVSMSSEVQSATLNDDKMKLSPRRLRKHSYKEAVAINNDLPARKMSGKMPELSENAELLENAEALIQKEEYAKKSTVQKLDTVAEAINKIYDKLSNVTSAWDTKIDPIKVAMFDEDEGLVPQMSAVFDHMKSADERIQSLTEENLQLRDELDLLKGVVSRIASQVDSANTKIHQLVAKSMEDNLVITGILDDLPKRSPRRQIHQFFNEQMNLDNINDYDIIKVFRIGKYEPGRNRPMMVQCTSELRRYILAHAPTLKAKLNREGGKYYINQQLP